MERLLVEINVGDGYSYSGVATYPIFHESKEKAISELETILLTYEINLEENNKKKLVAYKNLIDISKKLENPKNKNLAEEKIKIHNEYLELNNELNTTFKWSNNEFYYENFLSWENKKNIIVLPNIYTLNEYFEKVENKLNKKPSI